jgi:demethoxyubiquinone hydroxylase (CLK1/Coq7/Cat5 family)
MEVIARLAADESLGDRVMKVDHAGEHGAVNIYCRASIGRAGLVAVGTLLFLGVAEELAWQHASLARGRQVPDTDEQPLWVSKAFRQSSATSALSRPSI